MSKIERDFGAERLSEIVFGDPDYKVILDEVIDTTRWSIIHRVIFQEKETEKYYETSYSVGATEIQDEAPFEYHDGKATLVEPVEETVIVYKNVEYE